MKSVWSRSKTNQFPGVEVHTGEFSVGRLGNVNVETLTLIDKGATCCCHLEYGLLRYLPDSLVQVLQFVRNALNSLRMCAVH